MAKFYIEVVDWYVIEKEGYQNKAFFFGSFYSGQDIGALPIQLAEKNGSPYNQIRMYLWDKKAWERRRLDACERIIMETQT